MSTGVRTQAAVDDLAVVHLTPHGADFLQLRLLTLHPLSELLQLLRLTRGLPRVLLLPIPPPLLLQHNRGRMGGVGGGGVGAGEG